MMTNKLFEVFIENKDFKKYFFKRKTLFMNLLSFVALSFIDTQTEVSVYNFKLNYSCSEQDT